jgi:3-hydroxyacyl-CoA dehydrogenase
MKNAQDAKIGIVGAGAMGQGIAQIAAIAGLEVRLMDVDSAASGRAIAAIGAILDKLAAKGKLRSEQAQEALCRIHPEEDSARRHISLGRSFKRPGDHAVPANRSACWRCVGGQQRAGAA